MTVPIGLHSQQSNDWLEGFLKQQEATGLKRKVQADYFSRLKQHVEEQKNAGKYINVSSALDDFSQRLGLNSSEKTILAELVRYAKFDGNTTFNAVSEESLKEEVDEQGAPVSILPGVKPNRKTNKQRINKDLAQDETGQDIGGPSMPLSVSSDLKKKVIVTAGEVSPQIFEFKLDQEDLFITYRINRTGSNQVEISIKTKRENPPIIKTTDNSGALNAAKQIFNRIKKGVTDPATELLVDKEMQLLVDWIKQDFIPVDKKPVNLREKIRTKKEEEEDEGIFVLSDDLEDIPLADEEAKEEKTKPQKKGLETQERAIDRLEKLKKGRDFAVQLNTTRSHEEMLGIVAPDKTTLATHYKKAKAKYEDLNQRDTDLKNMVRKYHSAASLLHRVASFMKKGMTPMEALISAQEDFDSLIGEDADSDKLLAVEGRVKQYQSWVTKLQIIAKQEGLTSEELDKTDTVERLERKYREGMQRLNKELNATNAKLEEAEAQTLFYEDENDRVNLLDHLRKALPSLVKDKDIEDFDAYFAKLQDLGSKERTDFFSGIKEALDTTKPQQAKFFQTLIGLISDDSNTAREFKSIYKTLKGNANFLTVRPEHVQKVYENQLNSKDPTVKRKRNQVRKGDEEFVASIAEPSQLYKGYLSTEELLKASSLLLFGIDEGRLLAKYRETAIKILEEKRIAATREVLEQHESSLMANLSRLYAAAQDPENERARERYDSLLEEARKLVSPELRPYLIDPTEPIEAIITEDLVSDIVHREIIPEKILQEKRGAGGGRDRDQVDDSDLRLLSVLEKTAIKNGYALEAYDVSLSDHINTIYMDQCSRFMGSLTRKKNAYNTIFLKHSETGKRNAKKEAESYAVKRGLDRKWLSIVARYIDLYDKYLVEEIQENYQPFSIKNVKNLNEEDKKTLLQGGTSIRYTKPAKEKTLQKIDEDMKQAEGEQENYIRIKEAFKLAVNARSKSDQALVRTRGKSTQLGRLGETASLVFANVAKNKNFQVVTPEAVKQLTLTPDLLRKQIYDEAKYQGKHVDQYSANAILRRLLKRFYEAGSEDPGFDVSALVEIFPTSKQEKEDLKKGIQKTLHNGVNVASQLGARGVITGSNKPIFVFDSFPVDEGTIDGENYSVSEYQSRDKVEQVISRFILSVGYENYECWVGNDEQILQQIDLYRLHRAPRSLYTTQIEDPSKRVDFLLQYATDVEAVAKLSKSLYKDTTSALAENLTLDQLDISPEQARVIWETTVVDILRDPSNPLGIKDLPGPPKSRWGKKSGSNFLLDGNAWKIGKKSAVYQRTLEWLEGVTSTGQEDRKKDRKVRGLASQIGRFEGLMKRVVNHDPKEEVAFPTARELFGKKALGKTRLRRVQKLLNLITGREVSDELSADEAKTRLLGFIRNAVSDLQRERVLLINNGRGNTVLELTCPNPHFNATNSFAVAYIVKNSRMGLLNNASFDQLEEVIEWASEAIEDEDLAEEKQTVADRFKQDRFIILGRKPTCPVCGFKFENVDEELSNHIQEQSGKTVVRQPAEYLLDLSVDNARASFDYIIDKIRWLETSENKNVTRDKAPFDFDEIKTLAIAEADFNRPLKIRDPVTGTLETKEATGGGLLPLIKTILTEEDLIIEVDEDGKEVRIDKWEQPSSEEAPVLGQLEWQVQLYDLLQRWKKDLIKTFGFKDALPLSLHRKEKHYDILQPRERWRETYEEGLRRKDQPRYESETILRDTTDGGVVVGHEGPKRIIFYDNMEAQFGFYFNKAEDEPDVFVPKGKAWYDAGLKTITSTGEFVKEFFELMGSKDIEKITAFIRGITPEKILQKLFPPVSSAIKRDSGLISVERDVLLAALKAFEPKEGKEEESSSNRLSPKMDLIESWLKEAFGDFLEATPEEWAKVTDGKMSLVFQNRLNSLEVDDKIENLVTNIVDAVTTRSSGGLATFDRQIEELSKQYKGLTEAVAIYNQHELINIWSWLTNKIVRVKDDKRKQAKVLSLESPSEGEEESEKTQEDEFSPIKSMFKKNDFPTVEKVRSEYQIDVTEEDDLRRVDVLLAILNHKIKEFDSQHPKNVSSGSRHVGEKERLLNNFFGVVRGQIDKEGERERFTKLQEELRALILWNPYGYMTTDLEEIKSDILLMCGRYFPKTGIADSVLKIVSQRLVDINERYTELLDIRKLLYSKVNIQTSTQMAPEKGAPDPRFFYRITSVKPAGINRTKGPEVDFSFTIEEDGETKTKTLTTPGAILSFVEDFQMEEKLREEGLSSDLYESYVTLVKRAVLVRVKGYKFTTGSVVLELHPLLSPNDKYLPAKLNEISDRKELPVPESATKPVEYTLPMAISKGAGLYQYDTIANLREVVEEHLALLFDFADIAGDLPKQSTTEAAVDYLKLKRQGRMNFLKQLKRRLGNIHD